MRCADICKWNYRLCNAPIKTNRHKESRRYAMMVQQRCRESRPQCNCLLAVSRYIYACKKNRLATDKHKAVGAAERSAGANQFPLRLWPSTSAPLTLIGPHFFTATECFYFAAHKEGRFISFAICASTTFLSAWHPLPAGIILPRHLPLQLTNDDVKLVHSSAAVAAFLNWKRSFLIPARVPPFHRRSLNYFLPLCESSARRRQIWSDCVKPYNGALSLTVDSFRARKELVNKYTPLAERFTALHWISFRFFCKLECWVFNGGWEQFGSLNFTDCDVTPICEVTSTTQCVFR